MVQRTAVCQEWSSGRNKAGTNCSQDLKATYSLSTQSEEIDTRSIIKKYSPPEQEKKKSAGIELIDEANSEVDTWNENVIVGV